MPLPPRSMNAWRTRSRAAGLRRRGQPVAEAGSHHQATACESARSKPGTAAPRDAARPARSRRERSGARCRQLGMSTSRPGARRPSAIARSSSTAPASWPPTSGRGPHTSAQEAGQHLAEPLRRVRVARAVLGVAVQRQVGQHDAVAVRELVDHRLPLPVRESHRVHQRERRAGPGLAVGDPAAVGVVVEAQLHGSGHA